MRRLAIIPARGGSKGLPRKNLAIINGETLVERACRCAIETGGFSEVVLSSDDDELLYSVTNASALHHRPPELATDEASIEDVIKHVLERRTFKDFDVIALLQPTSPTRTPQIVRECVEAIGWEYDAAWTVSPVPLHYHRDRQLNIGHGLVGPGRIVTNRQSLEQTYIKNGLCYAVETKTFKVAGLSGIQCKPIITTGEHINIDTEEDLEAARRVLKNEVYTPTWLK